MHKLQINCSRYTRDMYTYSILWFNLVFILSCEATILYFILFTITNDSHDSKGRERTIFIPLPTFRHVFTNFASEMTTLYVSSKVITRLLLDEPYRLLELTFDWLLITEVEHLNSHHSGITMKTTNEVR